MISLSQHVLRLTSNCTYRCLGCPLHQRPFKPDVSSDFSLNKIKGVTHLVGGDALCATTLVQTLTTLRAQRSHPVIWTHGQFDLSHWAEILSFSPIIALYLPCPDEEEFNLRSGGQFWEGFINILRYLTAKDLDVILNFPVRPGMLEFIPEAHELAIQYKTRLLLHYHQSDFPHDSIAYIRRYLDYRKVYVLESGPPPPLFCPTFPYEGLLSPWQTLQNMWWHLAGSRGVWFDFVK